MKIQRLTKNSKGGCERRIEVFMKKNIRGGGVGLGRVKVDLNEELKFL